ncbi:MAG: hypothetical protein WA667_16640 [Candidatus Nitrosopolaris sp.]
MVLTSQNKREQLKEIVRDMCLTKFTHPSDPTQFITFLPPGAGIGTLVTMSAVSNNIDHLSTVKNYILYTSVFGCVYTAYANAVVGNDNIWLVKIIYVSFANIYNYLQERV